MPRQSAVFQGLSPRTTEDGEIIVTETEREKNVYAAYGITSAAATTWALLIDRSDTENWPHEDTGRIDISYLTMQVDRNANAVGSLAVGVVTSIAASTAHVSFFAGISFSNNSETHVRTVENYAPSQLKLGVVSGRALYLATTATVSTSAFGTSIPLNSYRGSATVVADPGDVVIRLNITAGSGITAGVRTLYHGETSAAV